MHAAQAYLQTNQIQKCFLLKAVLALQTAVFKVSAPQSSASVRIKTHNASAKNTTSLLLQLDSAPYSAKQPHGKVWKSLCWRQLSWHPCLNEANSPNCSQMLPQSFCSPQQFYSLSPMIIPPNLPLTGTLRVNTTECHMGKNPQGDINTIFTWARFGLSSLHQFL